MHNTTQARNLLGAMSKESLGFFPTPLHKLEKISKEFGVNLYLKRDDFSGRNLFGGNKVRKLEYLMGDAMKQGCEYVFTYGATQSNHAMQTAAACRVCGLKPILYLVALVPVKEEDIRANLLIDKIFGAEIHIVNLNPGETEEDAEERSFLMAKEHMEELIAKGHKCYDIPMGGASYIGSTAFIEGYIEMIEQMNQVHASVDYIFHATGTGGTLAGLIAGNRLLNSPAKIISINVSYKEDSYLTKVTKLANEALKHIGAEVVVEKSDLHTDLNFYAPGYEKPNDAATKAIRYLAQTEGILIDPVYTGKAFSGLIEYLSSGKVDKGSTVVFWHTGGATALFAEKEILGNDLLL